MNATAARTEENTNHAKGACHSLSSTIAAGNTRLHTNLTDLRFAILKMEAEFQDTPPHVALPQPAGSSRPDDPRSARPM